MLKVIHAPVVSLEEQNGHYVMTGFTGKSLEIRYAQISPRFGVQRHPDTIGWSVIFIGQPSVFFGAYSGRTERISDAKRLAVFFEENITSEDLKRIYLGDETLLREIKERARSEVSAEIRFD